jgi:hypothetical protein
MCDLPDFQKYNPGRSPSWRMGRALRLTLARAKFDARRDDEHTLRVAEYLRSLGPPARAQQPTGHPDLHAASCVYEHGGEVLAPLWADGRRAEHRPGTIRRIHRGRGHRR